VAKELGFATLGLVGDPAMKYGAPNDPAFDTIAVVDSGGSWGGFKPGAEKPLKEAKASDLVGVSQAIVYAATRPGSINLSYGGGEIASIETSAVANAGHTVKFTPYSPSKQVAEEKAKKAGIPVPSDIRGHTEKAMESGELPSGTILVPRQGQRVPTLETRCTLDSFLGRKPPAPAASVLQATSNGVKSGQNPAKSGQRIAPR